MRQKRRSTYHDLSVLFASVGYYGRPLQWLLLATVLLRAGCGSGKAITQTLRDLLASDGPLASGEIDLLFPRSPGGVDPTHQLLPDGLSAIRLQGRGGNIPVDWSPSAPASVYGDEQFTVINFSNLNSGSLAVVLTEGQELTLVSLSLYLVDINQPLAYSATLDTLAPSGLIRIPTGARLRLENVTLVLSDGSFRRALAAMCAGSGPWSYNPGLLIEGGTMRIASLTSWAEGEDGLPGAGGQVQWSNVTIVASPGGEPSTPYPCVARAITHGSQLGAEAAALLNATAGPVFLYITTDVTLPADGSWQTVAIPVERMLVLLGDPVRTTTLDLAGVESAWRLEYDYTRSGTRPGTVRLHHLRLLNLPYSTAPSSTVELLSVALLSFKVQGLAIVMGPKRGVTCVGCTLVLPDPEVAFLANMLRTNQSSWSPSPNTIEGRGIRLEAANSGVPSDDQVQLSSLTIPAQVEYSDCTLVSVRSYQMGSPAGSPPLLPGSHVWPPLAFMEDLDVAVRKGPAHLAVRADMNGALDAAMVLSPFLQPDANFTIVVTSQHDTSIWEVERAYTPWDITARNIWSTPDAYILMGYPRELAGHRIFINLRGNMNSLRLDQPLTLRNLVLYNLAPGGTAPLVVSDGSMTLAPPELSRDDAPWGNSTLPLWFFECARSPEALMRLRSDALASGQGPGQSAQRAAQADDAPELGPRLVLDNVTLVVPETEWRALAAAVLLHHAPEAMAAAQQRRQQQTGRRAQLQERRLSQQQTQAGGSAQLSGAEQGPALPERMWRRLRESTGWTRDRKLLPFGGSMERPEGNPWAGSVLPERLTPLAPPPVYGDPGVPSSPEYPPSPPPFPPPPRPPPLPPSDTVRSALESFAAASKVLSYDFKSGQLALAVARHYGWVGTNVTITYRLPPDAPTNATLLSYAPLSLPYEDLARMDIDVQLGDLPPSPTGLHRNPAPAATSQDRHEPDTGDGRPDWLLPVACTLASVIGVTLLIALLAMAVARQRRSRTCHRVLSALRSPGSTTEIKLPQVVPALSVVALTMCSQQGEGAEDPKFATQRSHMALLEDANKAAVQACSLLPSATAVYSDAAGSCSVQTDTPPGTQSGTIGCARLAALPLSAPPYKNYLAVVHDYYRQAVAGAEEDPMVQQQAFCPEPGSAYTLRLSSAPKSMAATIRALQSELRDPDLAVEAVLDCGASAVVYRGVWRGLPVAVKTLVVTGAAAGGSRQRAVLEAAISMSLTHPNVVATYAYDIKSLVLGPSCDVSGSCPLQAEGHAGYTESGAISTVQYQGDETGAFKVYIIQELCKCGSLRHALEHGMAGSIRGGGVRRLLALHLALDVAAGMRHIHASRIVHGDLKPANVLLVFDTRRSTALLACNDLDVNTQGSDGVFSLTAKVADFGLSVPLSEGGTHASQHFQGTPAYVAPEVFSAGQLSPRSDVWSFGMVLVELFYGTSLLEPNSLVGLGKEADDAPPDANRAVVTNARPSVPALLEDMAQQCPAAVRPYTQLAAECLDPEPRRRPDFTEITTRLQQLLTAEGHAASDTEVALSAAANVPAGAAVEAGGSGGQAQSNSRV